MDGFQKEGRVYSLNPIMSTEQTGRLDSRGSERNYSSAVVDTESYSC
jgi:hypothetical protein